MQPIIWPLEERISVCVTRKTKEHCSFTQKKAYFNILNNSVDINIKP